ncbi:hypothetical protein [Rhodococcus sp. 11-3]|uniref:hypothetical protein n=1 Tax=Rhodococcus sp. 11-3 TaxID=2854796 RepID=UPI00203B7C74|nr:hypothetical protein [Rhodococcus sp. 11-3]USC17029.1 hypothetical protein KZJ41_09255 [Rhodococcus sp. 11-3]
MSDTEYEDGPLRRAMESGDRREELVGLRDFIIHQLEGTACSSCSLSRLKAGEQAALILRLQQITEAIAAIPKETGEVTGVAKFRNERAARLSVAQDPASAAGA